MRELKFRIWQPTKNFLYFELAKGVTFTFETTPHIDQCTGLKDNNGKEIYEGDIVKDIRDNELYKVEFDLDRAGFVPFACGNGCGCCEADIIYDSEDVEIVGNIHENSDLLKGVEK